MKRLRLLASLSLVILLAACAVVPMGSLIPLARIDLMSTDLGALRAALRMPPALRPRPGGVQMDVVLKVEGQPDEVTALALLQTREPGDLAGLPEGGDGAFVYRLSPDSITQFEAIRQKLGVYRAERRSGSLGLGIATRQFCTTATLPAGAVLSSSYLMTSENAGYVTLLDGYDLRSDPKLAEAFATLEPC